MQRLVRGVAIGFRALPLNDSALTMTSLSELLMYHSSDLEYQV